MWQILYGVLAALLLEFIVVLILYILPRRRMRKLNRSAKVVLDSDCLQDMDAVNRTKLKPDFSQSLSIISKYSEREDCIWINAILARLVCQWYDSAVVRERLAEKLNRQVSDLASTYIGALCLDDELELDELVLPINPPTVKNVSVHGASQSGSFFAMFDLRFDSRIQISIKGRTSLKQQLDVRLLVDQIHAHAYMRITRTKGLIISWGLLDLPKFDLPEFSIKLDGASIGAWPIYFLKNWIIPFQLRRKLVIPFIKTIIRGGSRLPTTAEHKNPQLPEAPLDGTAVVDAALLNEGASNSPNANSLLVEQPSSLAVSPADSGGYSSRKSKLLSRVTLKIKERVPASLLANADHFKLAAGGLVQKARQTYKNNTRSSVTEATVATKTEPIASVPIVAGAVSGEDANEDEEAEEDDDLAEAVQIIDSLSAGNFQQLDDPVVEFGFLAEADHQFPPLLPLRSAVPTNIADDSKVIFNGELPPKEIRGIVVKIIDEALEGISVPPPLPNR